MPRASNQLLKGSICHAGGRNPSMTNRDFSYLAKVFSNDIEEMIRKE